MYKLLKKNFLNSKEKKELFKQLENQFGINKDFIKNLDYDIYINKKKKFYFLTREATNFIIENNFFSEGQGLYIGQIMPNNEIRLSIEGSQLLGPFVKNNIIEIEGNKLKDWIMGKEILLENAVLNNSNIKKNSFLIIKYENDFFGSGKIIEKENKLILLNYVPKTRYVHALFD